MKSPHHTHENGFTLIELIMVIVLLGIMGMMGAEFISTAFRGFADSDIRTEIFEEGKLALARMDKELRNAVPNALTTDNTPPAKAIEFGMIHEKEMAAAGVFGMYEEPAANFPIAATTGTLTEVQAAPDPGWIISVYNRNWTDFSTGARLFDIDTVTVATRRMTFTEQIVEPSPLKRFYVVDRAIRYSWDSATRVLSRAWAPVNAVTGIGAYSPDIPLARDVENFDCYYTAGALTRSGVISIRFTINRKGTAVHFHKEVGIRNVP